MMSDMLPVPEVKPEDMPEIKNVEILEIQEPKSAQDDENTHDNDHKLYESAMTPPPKDPTSNKKPFRPYISTVSSETIISTLSDDENHYNGNGTNGKAAKIKMKDIPDRLDLDIETNTSQKPSPPKRCGRYLGIVLTILSSMMFSINALIFKTLNAYHPLTPAVWMFCGTAVLTLPLYIYHRGTSQTEDKVPMDKVTVCVLLARAFTGCSGMLFFFYSLQYMSIGDALVIACSSPIFVFLLAFIFLKESCGLVPVITIVLALIGVIIITRPPLLTGEESFQNNDLIGAALAFSSMLSIASTLVLMRYLQKIHHSLINLIFGTWGTLQTLVLALAIDAVRFPEGIGDAVLMVGTGFVFFIGQTFLAVALQIEEAGPVSLVRTSEVVFAFIWQFLFLNVYPDVFSISGAILIMIGIFTTIFRKWIASLPPNHIAKKRFSLILK